MFHLGIPTTRALSIVITDETTMRDPLYNGTVVNEKMAIVTRVAPSFVRFGSFERFFYQNRPDLIKMLLNYTIHHHFPHLLEFSEPEQYRKFFFEVANRTGVLVAHWQAVGFTHGVLNTDNMNILGITIDYGPFGFLDSFDPEFVPNGSDGEGRYSFKNQPSVCRWNLEKLGVSLSPFLGNDSLGISSREIISTGLGIYDISFREKFYGLYSKKIGLSGPKIKDLVDELLKVIVGVDYTLFFRRLSKIPICDEICVF
eukprot:TRINITY_DN4424_c0_g1_i1.p1 TRINITY_DN4424_c0_g1~~TRINITY_DN4424_c0_g1_i1.p1  ORF type:complete len:257 (-),score=41.96 TRINITY_DN4424_c0_g1_i1:412-1182(-)